MKKKTKEEKLTAPPYKMYKISTAKIINENYCLDNYTIDKARDDCELVDAENCQEFMSICNYFKEKKPLNTFMLDKLVRVVVPNNDGSKAKHENNYGMLAKQGFYINGAKFIRFGAGSGQLRNNTLEFIREDLYQPIKTALMCGLNDADFDDETNCAKLNAYSGLSASGMKPLKSFPNVLVIDDYCEEKPHIKVEYLYNDIAPYHYYEKKGKKLRYFEGASPSDVELKVAFENKIGMSTGFYDEGVTIQKHDENGELYEEYKDFEPLNSFDGQGIVSIEYAKQIANEIGISFTPSQYIIRAPWVKGMVVVMDIKEFFKEHNITELTDIFGEVHNPNDIDIILSRSQFKMFDKYKNKGGWKYYVSSMKKNNLSWGVVVWNNKKDSEHKLVNYQYLNCLQLSDEEINDLCVPSVESLRMLTSDDPTEICKVLNITDEKEFEDDFIECADEDKEKEYVSLLSAVLKANPDFIHDTYVKQLIHREIIRRFRKAKIGKIQVDGNYQRLVSDPYAMLQFVLRDYSNYENRDKVQVTGLLKPFTIYSSYWKDKKKNRFDKWCSLFRSPMIDPSEVARREVVQNEEMNKWFSYIRSGIILPISDTTTLQLQNSDFDGDMAFSTKHPVIVRSSMDNPVPILYETSSKQVKGAASLENLIEADKRGLNSRVGPFSNKCAVLYAQREQYPVGSEEYEIESRYIRYYSMLIGQEIDKIKTAQPPIMPDDFKNWEVPQQIQGEDGKPKISICTKEEKALILKHNALTPNGIKPYYMRNIYGLTYDKKLTQLDSHLNREISLKFRRKYGIRTMAQLMAFPEEQRTNEMRRILRDYEKNYPLNTVPCTVNKICWLFEELEKKYKEKKGFENMLEAYYNPKATTPYLNEIKTIILEHFNSKRIIQKTFSNSNNKTVTAIAEEISNQYKQLDDYTTYRLRAYIEPQDIVAMFQHLYKLFKNGDIKIAHIWQILKNDITKIIEKEVTK